MKTPVTPIIDVESIKQIVHVRPPFQKHEARILNDILSSRALLNGHFSLLSEMHSDVFMRFNNFARSSENLEFIAELLVEEVKSKGDYDAVLSPDTAGVLLAYEVAKRLKAERIIASTDKNNMPTDIINFVDLKPGSKVLIVNDLTTTADGLKKLIQLVKKYGAIPIGIALFAVRDEKEKPEILELSKHCPITAIVDLKVKNHEFKSKDTCPICIASKNADIPNESWMLN